MASATDLDLSSSPVESPRYRTSAVATPVTVQMSASAGSDGTITLTDRGAAAKIMVRCDSGSEAVGWLGVAFGQCRTTDDVLIAGLRPEEFWLFGPMNAVDSAVAELVSHGVRSAVDLTHGRTLIEVSGASAAKMLEKVCGLDLSDAMTPVGSATSASVAKVTCDIVRSASGYLISCDRSFGQYLLEALADASKEFGFTLGA